MTNYNCPICGKEIPVTARCKIPQAYGLVRANHLRSHDIFTSLLTLAQKNDRTFLVNLWMMRQWFKAIRARRMALILSLPLPKHAGASYYELSHVGSLLGCPPDCMKRETCHRGQPLPYDKWICYIPQTLRLRTLGIKKARELFATDLMICFTPEEFLEKLKEMETTTKNVEN